MLLCVLDHRTKIALGWALGTQKTTSVALAAWRRATRLLRTRGRRRQGLIVHQDQDPVFTSYAWTGRLLRDRVDVSYALRGPRDNPEMEAFFGRFKTENRSLFLDAQTFTELEALVKTRLEYYNRERRHSRLGNIAPFTYADLCKDQP